MAVRELRAELVNAGTVVRRRLRPDGRSPRLCLCAWVLHPIRRQCTRSVGSAPVLIGCSVP